MDHTQSPGKLIAALSLVIALATGADIARAIMTSTGISVTAEVPGATVPTPTTSSGGGGGGGSSPDNATSGSGEQIPSANTDSVIFRGLAYPGSMIRLLKNGVVAASMPASPDATFDISLRGLTKGTYVFGLQAQDAGGRMSVLESYTIYVTTGVTTVVKGVFLPPTISIDHALLSRGDPLTVIGTSIPSAQVSIVFNSVTNLIKRTVSDASGAWVYKLDTLELEEGHHEVKARGQSATDITKFSPSLSFVLGSAGAPVQNYDVNRDGPVNLIDFSILAYWYRRVTPPLNADLSGDGKVDLIDFSILAYHWTG